MCICINESPCCTWNNESHLYYNKIYILGKKILVKFKSLWKEYKSEYVKEKEWYERFLICLVAHLHGICVPDTSLVRGPWSLTGPLSMWARWTLFSEEHDGWTRDRQGQSQRPAPLLETQSQNSDTLVFSSLHQKLLKKVDSFLVF